MATGAGVSSSTSTDSGRRSGGVVVGNVAVQPYRTGRAAIPPDVGVRRSPFRHRRVSPANRGGRSDGAPGGRECAYRCTLATCAQNVTRRSRPRSCRRVDPPGGTRPRKAPGRDARQIAVPSVLSPPGPRSRPARGIKFASASAPLTACVGRRSPQPDRSQPCDTCSQHQCVEHRQPQVLFRRLPLTDWRAWARAARSALGKCIGRAQQLAAVGQLPADIRCVSVTSSVGRDQPCGGQDLSQNGSWLTLAVRHKSTRTGHPDDHAVSESQNGCAITLRVN